MWPSDVPRVDGRVPIAPETDDPVSRRLPCALRRGGSPGASNAPERLCSPRSSVIRTVRDTGCTPALRMSLTISP
jgi:hypothetical protein